jgi:hypothetical protein
MPAHLPTGKRFETLEDVEDLKERYIVVLSRALPYLVSILTGCAHDRSVCNKPYCPICARSYRIYFVALVLELLSSLTGKRELATIFMRRCAPGELATIDLRKEKGALRKRLRRAGIGDVAVLIGGIEVCWKQGDNSWVLHAHLLANDAERDG